VTAPGPSATPLLCAAWKLRRDADAQYALPLRPPRARALADLLEAFDGCACDEDGDHWAEKSAALKVARLILGETEAEEVRDA
jgi:hypothetical protein